MIDRKTYEGINCRQYLECVYSKLGSLPINRNKSNEEIDVRNKTNKKKAELKYPLSSSVILEIKPFDEVKKLQIRKNAMSFAKNRKITKISGKETIHQSSTPFQNRKQKEKEIFEMKMKELKQKNSLAFQLEKNINKWLIIQQIETEVIKIKQEIDENEEKEQISQSKDHSSSNLKQKTEISLKESKMKKIGSVLGDHEYKKYLSETKKGVKCNNKIKSRIYHTTANLNSFTKLKVQSCSISKLDKIDSPSDNKIKSIKRTSRNKERAFSLNNSNINSSTSQQQSKLMKDSMHLKHDSESDCLKCVKIDLGFKSYWRPQTAIIKSNKHADRINTGKLSVVRGNVTREVTGWQNLGDSFQKQIYF